MITLQGVSRAASAGQALKSREWRAWLTFLGTGTSMGVPTLGCRCAVCTSADPHDRRLRPSLLLAHGSGVRRRERVVVIDTGPDFREQALRSRADAAWMRCSIRMDMRTTSWAWTICGR